MAEDRRATMRREAAQRAMARDEESRFQKVLERAGIVLLPGSAAYKEVLNTLKMYSEATGQSFQQVLSDPVQMGAIIGDPEDLAGYLKLPVDESDLLDRERLERRANAARAANERIDAAVHYSQATQSPRLAAYADEIRVPLGSGQLDRTGFNREIAPGSSQAMKAWKKNVDPEFLDRLSFIHWSRNPTELASSPRGVVDTPLSAAAYLKDDPGGMGTLFQKFSKSGPVGFIIEGEPSFIANMDVNSVLGQPQSMTTALMDPVLDEDTFLTDTRRAEFARQHSWEGSDEILEEMGASNELYQWRPFAGDAGHNEALIQKPRIVGIVVDPYDHYRGGKTGRPSLLASPRTERLRTMPERTAVILAEEMNLPLFDPGGKVLLQPEGVSDEQVQRASRNIPSGENIPRRVPDEEIPYFIRRGQDSYEASRIRARTRNNILKGLTEEINLHEDPNFRIDTDSPMGIHAPYGRYVDSPRLSREELNAEVERVRRRPDFDAPYGDYGFTYNDLFEEQNFHPSLAPPEGPRTELRRLRRKYRELSAKTLEYEMGSPEAKAAYTQAGEAYDAMKEMEEALQKTSAEEATPEARVVREAPAPMDEEYIESMQEQQRARTVTPRAEPKSDFAQYQEWLESEPLDWAEENAEFMEEQANIQRLEEEIQDAEQQLAAADPGTPEARQVASKLARAKAALAKLGYLAGVAGTAYEGGRFLGEVGRHGLLEGTQRYGGTVAKETGELLELPERLASGNPYLDPVTQTAARALGGAGRGLQRGGRALRGEREETRGVGLDPSVQGLDGMDLGIPEYTSPEMTPEQKEQLRRAQEQPLPEYLQPLRPNLPLGRPPDLREQTRNAARRALMSSRERDEENL